MQKNLAKKIKKEMDKIDIYDLQKTIINYLNLMHYIPEFKL